MATRRELITAGLLVAAGLAAGAWAAPSAAEPARPARLRLGRFLFDERFPEAAELARHMRDYGVPTEETGGDMADLWHQQLAPARPSPRLALAGITGADAFFVIERAAADHRMRLVYRGEHHPACDGRLDHLLSGPSRLIDEMAANAKPALDAAALARAMASCPVPTGDRGAFRSSTPAGSAERTEMLVSWIIAPRPAAGRA